MFIEEDILIERRHFVSSL